MYAASRLPASSGVSAEFGPPSVIDFDSNAFSTMAIALASEISMAMGVPGRGHEVEEPQVSSTVGRPPSLSAVLAVVAIALIAAGCALLIASYAPRPATAVWVG